MKLSFKTAAVFAAAAVFVLRLAAVRAIHGADVLYYVDSTAHILYRWWSFAGLLPEDGLIPRVLGFFHAAAMRLGFGFLPGALAVQISAGAASAALYFDAVRRVSSWPAAALAVFFAVSVPPFSRLVFSGQPEIPSLALLCLSLWLPCFVLARNARWRCAADLAVLALLAVSVRLRSENAGFFAAYAVFAVIRWRRVPAALGVIGLGFVAGLLFIAPGLVAHGAGAFTDNSAWAVMDNPLVRLARLPAEGIFGFFPFGVIAAAGALTARRPFRPLGVLFCVLAGQTLLLWAGSFFYLFSIELDRNLCAPVFLAMAPAAAVLTDRRVSGARFGRAGFFLAAGLAAGSWFVTLPVPPRLPPDILNARAAGTALQERMNMKSESAVILLEAVERSWHNTLVFSGQPDRFRLIATRDVEWGAPRVWKGEEPVAAAVVSSESVEASLNRTIPLDEKGRVGGFRVLAPRGEP